MECWRHMLFVRKCHHHCGQCALALEICNSWHAKHSQPARQYSLKRPSQNGYCNRGTVGVCMLWWKLQYLLNSLQNIILRNKRGGEIYITSAGYIMFHGTLFNVLFTMMQHHSEICADSHPSSLPLALEDGSLSLFFRSCSCSQSVLWHHVVTSTLIPPVCKCPWIMLPSPDSHNPRLEERKLKKIKQLAIDTNHNVGL